MTQPEFLPLADYQAYPPSEMMSRASEFYDELRRRRTVRDFSDKPVPIEVIEDCVRAAGTAPSGANMQPWHFGVVSDPAVKRRIRVEAEKEEKEFYERRAPQEWLDALAPLGTDQNKPFLETAPYLVVVFAENFGLLPDGRRVKSRKEPIAPRQTRGVHAEKDTVARRRRQNGERAADLRRELVQHADGECAVQEGIPVDQEHVEFTARDHVPASPTEHPPPAVGV